jgi:hypothetical protein
MEKQNQHFIQQAYMKGFSPYYFEDNCEKWEKEQIFVLNKQDNSIKQTTVNNVGCRKNYYSVYNENLELDSRIENIFNIVESDFIRFREQLIKIINQINLTNKPGQLNSKYRTTICEYVKLNYIRIPKIMDWIYKEAEKHEKRISEKYKVEYNKYSHQNISVRTMLSLFDVRGKDLAEYFFENDIHFEFFGRTKGTLITSDNPVIFYNDNNPPGLAYDDTIIIFPIDQNKLVKFIKDDGKDKYLRIQDMNYVDKINHILYGNATSEVYGPSSNILSRLNE